MKSIKPILLAWLYQTPSCAIRFNIVACLVVLAMATPYWTYAVAGAGGDEPNPIIMENHRPGTTDWVITRGSPDHQVEGYASKTSVAPDESFDIMVNVNAVQEVTWQAFRLGYYQGLGGRLVASGGPVTVATQPTCPVDVETGLIECHWTPVFRVVPDSSWVTGQYLIKLRRADGFQSYVPMVIREESRWAPMLVQSSVTTWQAYNDWGGASLYGNNPARTGFPGPRAYRVSFDRPYNAGSGSGQLQSYETWMLKWLEQRGYDVAYVTNVDIDAQPDLLHNRSVFLSVGHDEYWSVGERDAAERARDTGVSLVFLSANTAYWRIRLEPSSSGAAQRIETCYKDASLDPLGDTPEATVLFRGQPYARPENGLMGVMYETWSNIDGFPLVVTDPSHWLYEGTGVVAGETLPHIVGYEWDHLFDNGFTPDTLEVVAHAVGLGTIGNQVPADTTIYYPGYSNLVFASGTIEWAWGLNHPDYMDARVQRITENILAAAGLPLDEPTEVPPLGPPREPGTATTVAIVAGSGEPGYLDGAADVAQFNSPAGVAAHADGTLYVAEARNHYVRVVNSAGAVSTLAGCGPTDASTSGRYRDGIGLEACFNLPTGLAMSSNGTLYVGDTANHCIRAVNTQTRAVTTYAGTNRAGDSDATDPLAARFSAPRGVAVGPDQAVYVADTGNGKIRRIGPSGVKTVAYGLGQPTGVAVGADGTLYVIETAPPRVGRIPRLQAGEPPTYGQREVLAGGRWGDLGGPGAGARLRPAEGLAVTGDRLVFSDMVNFRVRTVDLYGAHNVATLVGDGRFGAGEGDGSTTRVVLPRGLTLYRDGVAIADSANHRVIFAKP
ncbi:MAG: SMP-30/gluconolactonase/LRE family protein [Acidobacteria bacterium]|nr:SMP-30/gluconolactonase/LRE family protein [Acidobacteriota bacterium]MBI3658362.1 SMP-30/gluconolactonase/LRE family protein [Acidobacteriota bacterium]